MVRIDYGTGHETTFAVFLFCLAKIGAVTEGCLQVNRISFSPNPPALSRPDDLWPSTGCGDEGVCQVPRAHEEAADDLLVRRSCNFGLRGWGSDGG